MENQEKQSRRAPLARLSYRRIRIIPLMISLFLFPIRSFSDDSVKDIYLEMVNGFPPTLSSAEANAMQARIQKESELLRAQFLVTSKGRLKSCDRYSNILRELVKQVNQEIQLVQVSERIDILSDDQVLNNTRLRLLIPGLFGLHVLFRNESEGGYGTIDRRIHSACPIPHRETVGENFDRLVNDLSQFNREGLGNPGLFGFERLIDRLFLIAGRQEDFQGNVSWGALGLATITSLVFWEFAPVAVASAATRFLIAVPSAVQPALVFGSRALALGGEGLAYHYLDRAILPPQSEDRKEVLASWEEQLRELQNLIETPLSAPQVYIAYLGQLRGQLATLYGPWLRAHLSQLNQELSADRLIGTLP